jgi:hypothetical protein
MIFDGRIIQLSVICYQLNGETELLTDLRLRFTVHRFPITIHELPRQARSTLRRRRGRRCGRRTVAIVTHTTSVDPIALAGRLLSTRTPGLVGRLIERIAMRRVPHPVTTRRGGRTCGHVTRNERLARCGRRRRRRGCGLARLRLLSCGCRFYAADLVNPIMK